MELAAVSVDEHLAQGRGRSVVEIGSRLPNSSQGGRVEPFERPAQTVARQGSDRTHVVEHAVRAVGEVSATVTGWALQAFEEVEPAPRGGGERPIWASPGTFMNPLERRHVSRKGIEFWAQPRLGVAERHAAGAFIELRIRQETGAAKGPADVVFEILDLIEIGAPMQAALAGPALA